jgi:hypothetical protein
MMAKVRRRSISAASGERASDERISAPDSVRAGMVMTALVQGG